MRRPWNIVRCKLGRHRWETVQVGPERGKECRHCKERIFDKPGSDDVRHVADTLGGAGGISGSV